MIEILTAIEEEPWAEALHLEALYLPLLRSVPPDQLEEVRAAATGIDSPRGSSG